MKLSDLVENLLTKQSNSIMGQPASAGFKPINAAKPLKSSTPVSSAPANISQPVRPQVTQNISSAPTQNIQSNPTPTSMKTAELIKRLYKRANWNCPPGMVGNTKMSMPPAGQMPNFKGSVIPGAAATARPGMPKISSWLFKEAILGELPQELMGAAKTVGKKIPQAWQRAKEYLPSEENWKHIGEGSAVGAGAGGIMGGAMGAIDPGEDEEGHQNSRIYSALQGALGGSMLGGLAGGAGYGAYKSRMGQGALKNLGLLGEEASNPAAVKDLTVPPMMEGAPMEGVYDTTRPEDLPEARKEKFKARKRLALPETAISKATPEELASLLPSIQNNRLL